MSDPERADAPLLRDPDFRRLWSAGLITYFVRWLEVLVFGVFTYERTGSAFAVAGMLMLRMVPLGLLGVPFGAWAARVPGRAGVVAMLGTLATTSTALLAAVAGDALEVWHVALACAIGGVVWAADNPLRRALVGELAGTRRMAKAMALDVGASNACKLAGPGAGGFLLAHGGMAGVLAVTLALYLVAIAMVLRIRPRARPAAPPAAGVLAILADGANQVRAVPRLAAALWVTVVFNLFGWPVLSMVPVIGRDRLGLGPDGVGLLAGSDGLGTLIGALALAAVPRPPPQGRTYVAGCVAFFVAVGAFSAATHPVAAALLLFLSGLGQAAFAVMQATLTIGAVTPERRTQAMGLLTVAIGTAPLGFLALGALAERVGAPIAVGASCAAGLAVLALTRRLWRVCWDAG
ncbi:MAG: MFS transporter [Burkholderiales bacterium]